MSAFQCKSSLVPCMPTLYLLVIVYRNIKLLWFLALFNSVLGHTLCIMHYLFRGFTATYHHVFQFNFKLSVIHLRDTKQVCVHCLNVLFTICVNLRQRDTKVILPHASLVVELISQTWHWADSFKYEWQKCNPETDRQIYNEVTTSNQIMTENSIWQTAVFTHDQQSASCNVILSLYMFS